MHYTCKHYLVTNVSGTNLITVIQRVYYIIVDVTNPPLSSGLTLLVPNARFENNRFYKKCGIVSLVKDSLLFSCSYSNSMMQ